MNLKPLPPPTEKRTTGIRGFEPAPPPPPDSKTPPSFTVSLQTQ